MLKETINQFNHSHKIQSEDGPIDSKSPVKSSSSPIDLFDLIKSKSLFLQSQDTTNDTSSVKTEEETSRSNTSDNNLLKVPKSNEKKNYDDPTMTIKEIISKRCYLRKANKKITNEESDVLIKRKAEPEINVNEVYSTKRQMLSRMGDDTISKKIILKDGKPTIEETIESEELLPMEIVTDNKKIITSNSFKTVSHSEKWSEKDTRKFYRALELFGTDFSLITKLFPSRNRNQIKNKFLKEEKMSKQKIDLVLGRRNVTGIEKIYKKARNFLTQTGLAIKKEESESNIGLAEQMSMFNPQQKNRSDSFHSTSSVDSLDMSIIENISELFKK